MKKTKKENEPTGAKKVFQVIFIVISFFLGLSSLGMAFFYLISEVYFGAFLSLLFAVFAFLPKKITRVPYWARATIIFISIQVILVTMSLTVPLPEVINHNLQEEFIFDVGATNFSMIIYNTTKATSILVGNQEKTTTGYFIIVNCELANLGQYAVNLSMNKNWYNLMDDQNKTYLGSSNLQDQETFQPNLEKKFYYLFEIPKTAQGINLQLRDRKDTHIINLNL